MRSDPGLEATRTVRKLISREYGNDPRRLVEYYLAYQKKLAGRLRRARGPAQDPEESTGPADAKDVVSPDR